MPEFKPGQLDTYKDQPLLVLDPESRYCFQFGLKKDLLILQEIGAVIEFARRFGPKDEVEALIKKAAEVVLEAASEPAVAVSAGQPASV